MIAESCERFGITGRAAEAALERGTRKPPR